MLSAVRDDWFNNIAADAQSSHLAKSPGAMLLKMQALIIHTEEFQIPTFQ